MTTERAIELLHRLQDEQFDGIHGDERREALEKAVRALVDQNLGEKTIDCIIERLDGEDTAQPTQTNADSTQSNALDYVSRQAAIDAVVSAMIDGADAELVEGVMELLPSAQPQWIPCSERLPEDIRPVIVTWKNTDPASYYQYIVGKHFTGTACYKNGKWYWYSSTTEDMLSEYGRYDSEEFDEAIECIAWMPLPKSYGGESE